MYKKSYFLKQITPILQFQYDEGGNCFRITEFKPKLDKFMKKYISKTHNNVDLSSHFIPKTESFNYKVKVKSVTEPSDNIDIGQNRVLKKLYFASGMDENASHGVFAGGTITLEFISYDTELMEWIEECVGPFLSIENFGTRQNKGFGGYYIDNSNEFESDLKKAIYNVNNVHTYLRFSINGRNNSNYKLDNVLRIYERLKSGSINIDKTYLAKYFGDKVYEKDVAIGSDKDNVRYKFFSRGNIDSYNDVLFTNALLGLADTKDYVFRNNNRLNDTVLIKPLKTNHKELSGKNRYDKDINRFKSPITFKIFEDYVYVIANDFNESILDREFEFSTKKGRNTPFIMRTPNKFELEHLITCFGESESRCTLLKVGDLNE